MQVKCYCCGVCSGEQGSRGVDEAEEEERAERLNSALTAQLEIERGKTAALTQEKQRYIAHTATACLANAMHCYLT